MKFFKKLTKEQQENNFKETNNKVITLKEILANKKEAFKICEPQTIAKIRLENEAKDFGAELGRKCLNNHKAVLKNQWINALTSLNTGFSNQQYSWYNYQVVNYWEASALQQDPLMNKVLNILSTTPLSKGGEIQDEDLDINVKYYIQQKYNKLKINEILCSCLKTSFSQGGCLLYMDFGDINLSEPLDLKRINIKTFRGFKLIEPINVAGLNVNTAEPSKQNYMEPENYYIVGLGVVHKSHFLKFIQNEPPLILKPLCLYFGFPLTTLIKQDIANTNMVSQSIAELIGRFRYVFLKTPRENFAGSQVQNFKERLEAIALLKDNYQIDALSTEEDIVQINTQLAGLKENEEFFYQIISSKTNIPFTELMGKSADGMNATGEGDRKNWYDKVINIQQSFKSQLLTILGIVAGLEDGKYKEILDYYFYPLETLNQREQTELTKAKLEIAKTMLDIGYKSVDVGEWLKSDKLLNLGNMEFEEQTDEDLIDYETLPDEAISDKQE